MDQLKPAENEGLVRLLREFIDVFAGNPKILPACEQDPMRLKLKDLRCAPSVAPTRYYSLEQRKIVQAEVGKLRGERGHTGSELELGG